MKTSSDSYSDSRKNSPRPIDVYTAAKKAYNDSLQELVRAAGATAPNIPGSCYQPQDALHFARYVLHRELDNMIDAEVLRYPPRVGPLRLVTPTYFELDQAVNRG